MPVEIADEVEVRCKAAVLKHPKAVAADWKDTPGLDCVMLVEIEAVRMLGNSSLVNDGLAVILAGVFQSADPEEAIGR